MKELTARERRQSHLTDDPTVVQKKVEKLVKDMASGVVVPRGSRVRDPAIAIARPAIRAGFERGFSQVNVREILKDVGAVIRLKDIKAEYEAWKLEKDGGAVGATVGGAGEQAQGVGQVRGASEYVSASDFRDATIRVGDIPEGEERRENYVESVVASLCSAAKPKLASSLDMTEALEEMVAYASDLHGGRIKKSERSERRQAVLACARPGVVSVETLEGLLSGPLGDRG